MSKKVFIIIFLLIVILATVSYFAVNREQESGSIYSDLKPNEKILTLNDIKLVVEIADEPHEQGQGLSGRESLDDSHGMLFIFPESSTPGFWMKDMKFPLDLIWIDENNRIIEITKNVSPDTFPQTFSPPSPVKYVLEVIAGWSDENKIKVGDKMMEF